MSSSNETSKALEVSKLIKIHSFTPQLFSFESEPTYKAYSDEIHKQLELVVCLRCGRPLTNEKSRQARLGPKCARKLAYETRTCSYSLKTLNSQVQSPTHSNASCPRPLFTQQISLYYLHGSGKKPYCRLGSVKLPAKDSKITSNPKYQKLLYSLPLIEGITYEIFQQLPQPRVFYLQVNQKRFLGIKDFKSQRLNTKENTTAFVNKLSLNHDNNNKFL